MMKIALFCSGGQGPESQYTPEMTYAPKRAVDWDACADEEISLTFYVKLPGSLVVDTKNGIRKTRTVSALKRSVFSVYQ